MLEQPDRFLDIKRQVAELDAAGRLSTNSPLRWLVSEVDRLRLILSTLPLEEIKACAAYANQSRHPGIVVDAKTVSTWIRAQLKLAESDRCDPARGYHSNPHKGCILR